MRGLDKKIMRGWREYTTILEKQLKCKHKNILWGADGKTGICLDCGITLKR